MPNERDRTVRGLDRIGLMVITIAIGIAAVSARPYAGGWNDGTRLATAESLVDHHTWAIDQSIFAGAAVSGGGSPYPASDPALQAFGTRDKMWINGHFYSDKGPVPNLYLALVYRLIQFITGLTARDHPGWFCYLLTLASSGVAFVISVYCIYRLTAIHGLPGRTRVLVALSFSLGTIALPYARHVNSHILLLGVCSAVILLISKKRTSTRTELLMVGALAGVGYTLDVAIGSILVIAILGLLIARNYRWTPAIVMLAAAFPWFALHHALNYMIGGSLLPANTNPAFFQWPGSPFDAQSLTGGWHHAGIFAFIGYAMDLLVGHRGFLWHDLPLLLALPGTIWLLRQNLPEKDAVWFAIGFSVCSWLIYAVASGNHAGLCCSVRWFVPLLAPGYYILVLLLQRNPSAVTELRILSIGGIILGALMWWQGPWNPRLVPGFWLIVGATVATWLSVHFSRRRAAEIIDQEGRRAVERLT